MRGELPSLSVQQLGKVPWSHIMISVIFDVSSSRSTAQPTGPERGRGRARDIVKRRSKQVVTEDLEPKVHKHDYRREGKVGSHLARSPSNSRFSSSRGASVGDLIPCLPRWRTLRAAAGVVSSKAICVYLLNAVWEKGIFRPLHVACAQYGTSCADVLQCHQCRLRNLNGHRRPPTPVLIMNITQMLNASAEFGIGLHRHHNHANGV